MNKNRLLDFINRHKWFFKQHNNDTMTSVESIRKGFPFPVIAKHPGLPTYETIADVHLKLKANAASVPSKIGGGAHGLLGLILPPATYTLITNEIFWAPVNPGSLPVVADTATQYQISKQVRQHKEELRIWQEYRFTNQALKQQLLQTFDEAYVRGLRNYHTGYTNISTQHLMTYLYTTYGVITPADIEDNDSKMREPFDPTQPIETLFDEIESAFEYADAGQRPYNSEQVVSRAYLLILQIGMYPEA